MSPSLVGALTPYIVDADRCLVGRHLDSPFDSPSTRLRAGSSDELRPLLARYEPQVSTHAHLMCTECQKVCPLGERSPISQSTNFPIYQSTTLTFSAASTASMGLMIVAASEPAKSSPTTCLSISSTAEPESPGWLIGPATSWPVKSAVGPL